jgi:ferredoxin
MTAEALLNVGPQEGQRIPKFPGLCKRVRFIQSDCRRCLDICPENAISLDPGPIINDSCSSCGLCQTACPTEVFQDAEHTDQHHLIEIGASIGNDSAPGEKRLLFIHCQQAEKQTRDSYAIPCLGSITEDFMVGAAGLGFDEVVLTKGTCSRCRLKQGEQLLTNSIDAFRVLCRSTGLKNFTLKLREDQKEEGAALSRRAFFARSSVKQNEKVEFPASSKDNAMLGESSGAREGTRTTRPSPKREFLRTLLAKTPPSASAVVAYGQSFPWGNIKIDEDNCVTCGICVNVCPTGAISRKTSDEYLSHYFKTSLCTNCRLCEEACPQKVISFRQDLSLTDVLKDEAHPITRIALDACLICGEVIPAREGEICTTCDKRQMSSRFLSA